MKLKINIFILLFSLTSLLYSQAGNAYYKKQLSSDTNHSDNDYMKKALSSLENSEYKLSFNESESLYSKVKNMDLNDSPIAQVYLKGISGFDGEVYFNKKKNKNLHKREFAGGNYLIKKNEIKWILSKDTLNIDRYTCYKASTTRIIENQEGKHKLKVTAWYAPQIPLPYGPDGYCGLPGLILQLDNNGTTTSLKKIEFSNKNLNIDFIPTGKEMSEDEFKKRVSEIYKNRKN